MIALSSRKFSASHFRASSRRVTLRSFRENSRHLARIVFDSFRNRFPVYLAAERALVLAIVSAREREEPELWDGDADVGGDIDGAATPPESPRRQQKPATGAINTHARPNSWRVHRVAKSPVFGRLSMYLLRGWPFFHVASRGDRRVYLFPPASRIEETLTPLERGSFQG